MAEQDREFAHESFQDRESVVQYLAALGDGFQHGKLLLSTGGEEFMLDTPPLVQLDVRAKQKNHRGEIVIRVSWKNHKPQKTLTVESIEADGRNNNHK